MNDFIYSHWRIYKFACFTCRKITNAQGAICPVCGDKLHSMGTHFRAPKRTDDKAWEAVEILYSAGIRFDINDVHYNNGWTELYAKHGNLFNRWDLRQMLGENRALELSEGWKTHWHYPGQRPTRPRDAVIYVRNYQQIRIQRIALVFEACKKMGISYPTIEADLIEPVLKIVEQRSAQGYAQTEHLDDELSILERLPKNGITLNTLYL